MTWIHLLLLFTLILSCPALGLGQWTSQQVPQEATMLLTVDFADSLRGASSGWGPGFGGRAIYTSDGGTHWNLAAVPDTSRSLVTLQLVNADTGYIAGSYNVPPGSTMPSSSLHKLSARQPLARAAERYLQKIGRVLGDQYRALFLRTTDGGKSWQDHGVLPDSMGYLIGESFVDARTGYVTGDGLVSFTNVSILKTTDGGSHWVSHMVSDSVRGLRNIHAIDAEHVFAVGYSERDTVAHGIIVRTTDGGENWTEQGFPATDSFNDVFFSDAATGYAVGVSSTYSGIVLKTTDGGSRWDPVFAPSDAMILDVVRFLPGTSEGIVAGERIVTDSGGMQVPRPYVGRTTDGGATWTEELLPGAPEWTVLPGGDLLSHDQAYLCGGSGVAGALFRFNDGTASAEITGRNLPEQLSLFQNYPNPFNPTTTIRYALPQRSHVTLSVFNTLGQQVAALIDEEIETGYHEVTFTGQALSSGVYFYRLQAGDYFQTRKLLLT